MGREQEPETFEWVNRWAENAAWSAPVKRDQPPNRVVIARIAPRISKDQLARDMAEIERARDALDTRPIVAGAAGQLAVRRQRQALTLVAPRTTDPVPVMIGGVFALVMLTVFGAAAAMGKFSR